MQKPSDYDMLHDYAVVICEKIKKRMRLQNCFEMGSFGMTIVAGVGFISWVYDDLTIPPQYQMGDDDTKVCYPELYRPIGADGVNLDPPSILELRTFRKFCESPGNLKFLEEI
jgi:hypothetical protein